MPALASRPGPPSASDSAAHIAAVGDRSIASVWTTGDIPGAGGAAAAAGRILGDGVTFTMMAAASAAGGGGGGAMMGTDAAPPLFAGRLSKKKPRPTCAFARARRLVYACAAQPSLSGPATV